MISQLRDASVTRLVQIALTEDIGTGDISSESVFDPAAQAQAVFLAKSDGVICGLPLADMVFQSLRDGEELVWHEEVQEGSSVLKGTVIARLEGSAITLLSGERTALNFLQRMSGVASMARRFVDAIEGTRARILDTRKTIPGWRLLDKYAARCGGATNHRMGLYDMVMLKDNHILAAGGMRQAIERCRKALAGEQMLIEVETGSLQEVEEALATGGVDRIMFDNFTPELMREAVALVAGRVETEASGGITLANVRDYAETGVDFISIGAITHSAPALDISMDFTS